MSPERVCEFRTPAERVLNRTSRNSRRGWLMGPSRSASYLITDRSIQPPACLLPLKYVAAALGERGEFDPAAGRGTQFHLAQAVAIRIVGHENAGPFGLEGNAIVAVDIDQLQAARAALAQRDAACGSQAAVLGPLAAAVQELEFGRLDVIDAPAAHVGGELVETVAGMEDQPAGDGEFDGMAAVILHRPGAGRAAIYVDFRAVFVNHVQAGCGDGASRVRLAG